MLFTKIKDFWGSGNISGEHSLSRWRHVKSKWHIQTSLTMYMCLYSPSNQSINLSFSSSCDFVTITPKFPCVAQFLCLVNGFVGSSGGNSLGKIIPPKSPPLPPPGNSRKTDLRVVIPQSKGMMQTLVSESVWWVLSCLQRLSLKG